eukprot:14968-Heterococcus_DN1.PRE.1
MLRSSSVLALMLCEHSRNGYEHQALRYAGVLLVSVPLAIQAPMVVYEPAAAAAAQLAVQKSTCNTADQCIAAQKSATSSSCYEQFHT